MNPSTFNLGQTFKIIRISILFLFSLMVIQVNAQEIKFHKTSQQNIERIADTSNKPYFIYLYEAGNFDCHKMETYTFADDQLATIVNKNLIANKIDANSEEGKYLQQSYAIKLLPAVLFFNESEELLLQQEVAMGSVSFLKLLSMLYKFQFVENASSISQQQFDNAKKLNVSIATQYAIVEPSEIKEPNLLDKKVNTSESISTASVIEKEKKIESKPKVIMPNTNLLVKAPSKSTESVSKEITKKLAVDKSVITPAVKTTNSSNTSMLVQLGAYNKYVDVVDSMMKLQSKTNVNLSIIEEDGNGRLMYKLVSANTLPIQEAKDLAKSLRSKGIDCFVRKSK